MARSTVKLVNFSCMDMERGPSKNVFQNMIINGAI